MSTRTDIFELYAQSNQFGKENGLELLEIAPGHIEYRMRVLPKHLALPIAAHGGAIAGMMDAVVSVAGLSATAEDAQLVGTVEFKIQYLRPALLDDVLIGEGKVVHRGKRLLMTSGEIRSEKTGEIIALGSATLNAYPFQKSFFE